MPSSNQVEQERASSDARPKEDASQVKAHLVELGSHGYRAPFQPAPEFVFMISAG